MIKRISYWVFVTIVILGCLLFAVRHAQASERLSAAGQAGSALSLPKPLPDGLKATQSPCADTLAEVKSRLPMDYGTRWAWASLKYHDAAGLYFLGQNTIIIDSGLDCQWVPIVAAHEWVHQAQDLAGLTDHTKVNGYERMEVIAECTARVIAAHEGWPHYKSYPELTGVPCTAVSADVQALLSTV